MWMFGIAVGDAARDAAPALATHHLPGLGFIDLAADEQVDRAVADVAELAAVC